MDFLLRHPIEALRNPRRMWAVRKVMKQYAKAYPVCEWTGSRKIEVHHIRPIHVRPELAADPDNMIGLGARDVHRVVGHGGNFQMWIPNVRELCQARKLEGKR